ncbi:MAG: glutamate synthase large subunit [Brevinematia bacterium]
MQQCGLYDPRFEHDACGVGFIANIKGEKSHKLVEQSLEILNRLAHRGATGADPKTGDGAGILIQLPDKFFRKECERLGINLPEEGKYGTGIVFLPKIEKERETIKEWFVELIKEENLDFLGYRKVPVDNTDIGKTAKESEPVMEQIFVGYSKDLKDSLELERKLYILRKKIENRVRNSSLSQKSFFYITNLSSRTFSYKGMLTPEQVGTYFLDLSDPSIESAIVLVHSRFSTNTFPTWDLAQPFRYLAHNGEINTLRGNINWMKAKEGSLKSELFGEKLKEIFPTIVPGGSDSAMFDNVFELLYLAGRSIEEVMSIMVPAAWEKNPLFDQRLKDFYLYNNFLMEPWDGPAAMAFTDGKRVAAVLDRNGLRPARYLITSDNIVIMASEVGVLDIEPEKITKSARLEPGKMLYIDTEKGLLIEDKDLKKSLVEKLPYSEWIKEKTIFWKNPPKGLIDEKKKVSIEKSKDILLDLKAFGYTREDLRVIIKPMAIEGQEPVGAMGNDTPHAILSKKPQLLYTYFKQLFAQVTNPPIDPIREEVVMSLSTFIGKKHNLLQNGKEHCEKIVFDSPIIKDEDFKKILSINDKRFKTKMISVLYNVNEPNAFKEAIDNICLEAEKALKEDVALIILSDRGVSDKKAPLPMLLAVGAVHQHLVKISERGKVNIIVESGEPREVHHFATLFGYGADLIYPYLAYEAIENMVDEKEIELDKEKAIKNYVKSIDKAILKILSKMGISTLQSYRGAQIFEALGISEEVIEKCFTGTVSRIGGATFETLAKENLLRHKAAYPDEFNFNVRILDSGGQYQWKKDGEFHLWNPESIAALQDAVRKGDYQKFKEFSRLINDQSNNPTTLRSLLRFKKTNPIPIEEVESVESIMKRFVTGAMSFGSISRGAHESMAIAMNRIGGKSNTGEGGEDPERFKPLPNGDSKRSAIKQVASGRFGVTTNYLVNADELQIKIAQGAKPGEGGQLPGHKVSVTIAKTRYTTPGVTLISPPPHHDIYSIEDLAQLIFDLKNVNPDARISVKLVSEIGVGTIAAGVAKGHADMILISGGDGGTGASPVSSIKHAGLPWELGLSETHQTLVLNNLRSRVRLQTDGQMRTGRDVVIAAILGAEEYGFSTAALVTLGCVMLRHCNLNNCSVGVATQDEILERRFQGKPEYLVNFMKFVAMETREIMASLGVRTIEELIGKTDLLEENKDIFDWKFANVDFSRILYKPQVDKSVGVYCQISQDHGIDNVLDRKLIELAKPALEKTEKVYKELEIKNVNRTTGAMLSGAVCKKYGEMGLNEDTIHFKFKGVAGQSFGAWLAKGITFELEGLANDYVGKGISGGKIIIYPFKNSKYKPEENIIIGNTTFYGAISGEAYIRGVAGERFCIRNSGLNAVVEGVGDHGCEYMTGGHVVIIGKTGINFAAGMSGGIAYVYDEDKDFTKKCNMEMVELTTLEKEDENMIKKLLSNHQKYTGSEKAKQILENFEVNKLKFIKVFPLEYKKILEARKVTVALNLSEVYDG